jgi:hypothetical protein
VRNQVKQEKEILTFPLHQVLLFIGVQSIYQPKYIKLEQCYFKFNF